MQRRLAKLGLARIGDLLSYRPFRYEQAVAERRISELFGDEEVAIEGTVLSTSVRKPRRGLTILEAVVSDGTGSIKASWFNQGWLKERLQPGTYVRLRGQTGRYGFTVKSYDIGEEAHATADFAPVYPASEDVAPKRLRELVESALSFAWAVPDPLPSALKAEEGLPFRADALHALHGPRSLAEAETGRRRLAFDELLVLQIGLAQRAREREATIAPALGEPGELVARYREALPFTLTEHQERAIAEIDVDLATSVPMRRLLQGDVGSGKTAVALYALLRAVERGRQGALMAPTETLAEQHFLTLDPICAGLGVPIVLLTSSLSAKEHASARAQLATGEAPIAVGTHALIQTGVDFADLAVAVVDEQHRFGVEQRRALAEGRAPHVLHMTATPIPRTLALTVYGDLAGQRDREAAREPQARRHPLDPRGARLGGLHAPAPPPRRGAAGLRRLPADRGLRDVGRTRGRGRGRAAAPRRAEGLPRRLPPRAAQAARATRLDGELQGTRAGRARRDDGDRGRRRRPERDGDDRAGGRPLRPRAASPAPRPRRSRLRAVVLPARLPSEGGADRERRDAARRARRTNDGFELAEVDLELRGTGQLIGTRQAGLRSSASRTSRATAAPRAGPRRRRRARRRRGAARRRGAGDTA